MTKITASYSFHFQLITIHQAYRLILQTAIFRDKKELGIGNREMYQIDIISLTGKVNCKQVNRSQKQRNLLRKKLFPPGFQ